MPKVLPVLLLSMIPVTIFTVILWRANQLSFEAANQQPKPLQPQAAKPCVPTFVDGGGPYYKTNSPFRTRLAPETHAGEELTVTGKVLSADCVTPLNGVTLDIWQANESGSYEDEWYRGRVTTNQDGEYSFTTVVPKGYGEGTGYRPPHIHFKVWQGETELITSQMFMPASRAQGIEEPYIMEVTTMTENGTRAHQGQHDIVVP